MQELRKGEGTEFVIETLSQTSIGSGLAVANQYLSQHGDAGLAWNHAVVDRDAHPKDLALRDAEHYLYMRFLSNAAANTAPDSGNFLGQQAVFALWNLGYDPLKALTGNLFGTATPPSWSSFVLGFKGQWDGRNEK